MARTKNQGNGRLKGAMALLIQNQASFLARIAEIDSRIAETNRINSERFARIENLLLEHNRILAEHTRTLEALPEVIRQKIGLMTPQPSE